MGKEQAQVVVGVSVLGVDLHAFAVVSFTIHIIIQPVIDQADGVANFMSLLDGLCSLLPLQAFSVVELIVMGDPYVIVKVELIQLRVFLHLFEDILIRVFEVSEGSNDVGVRRLEVWLDLASVEEGSHCLLVLFQVLKGRAGVVVALYKLRHDLHAFLVPGYGFSVIFFR